MASPVTPFTTCARFTYSPSVTPAPTASSSFTVRTSVPAMTRPFHLSSRPTIDGSVGTLSRRAEPSTYVKPAGKRSTMLTSVSSSPATLCTVIT